MNQFIIKNKSIIDIVSWIITFILLGYLVYGAVTSNNDWENPTFLLVCIVSIINLSIATAIINSTNPNLEKPADAVNINFCAAFLKATAILTLVFILGGLFDNLGVFYGDKSSFVLGLLLAIFLSLFLRYSNKSL